MDTFTIVRINFFFSTNLWLEFSAMTKRNSRLLSNEPIPHLIECVAEVWNSWCLKINVALKSKLTVLTGQYDIKTRQQIVKMILEEIMGFLFLLKSTLVSSSPQLFREKRDNADSEFEDSSPIEIDSTSEETKQESETFWKN